MSKSPTSTVLIAQSITAIVLPLLLIATVKVIIKSWGGPRTVDKQQP